VVFHQEVRQKVLVEVEQVQLVDAHVEMQVALGVQEFVFQLIFLLLFLQLVAVEVLVVMLMDPLPDQEELVVVEQVEQGLVGQVKQELQAQLILAVEVDHQVVDQLMLIQALVDQD
tara:strand:+ start:468 stop:815 length:348 start_codon:yes stop_codon:yes gene_type:complete